MKNKNALHLILGASNGIGRKFFNFLSDKNIQVLGTGYQNLSDNRLVYFDALNHNFNHLLGSLPPKTRSKISWIHLFYGVSNPNWIEKNPSISNILNVKSKLSIINEAIKNNINIGFPSTDYVFGGDKDSYTETDLLQPTTLYGKQKLEIEKYITENTKNHLIVRFSPNIFPGDLEENCRVASVYKSILQKNAVMAQDVRFNLTEVSDTCRAYYELIKSKCTGIFHTVSGHTCSWEDLAKKIKGNSLATNHMAFKSCSFEELNFFKNRPKITCLNNSKLTSKININFSDIDQAINKKVSLLDSEYLTEREKNLT